MDVLWVHFDMVERFFTDHPEPTLFGVFNMGMLESALGRPQQTVFGADAYPTLAGKAAALTHSLVLNHAFNDANKRTGILSGCIFMMTNGCDVRAGRGALYQTAIAVENKTLNLEGLTEWFDDPEHVVSLTEDEWDQVQSEEIEERIDRMP